MFFKDTIECQKFVRLLSLDPDRLIAAQAQKSAPQGSVVLSIEGIGHRSYVLAKHLVQWLGPFQNCLMWLTEFGSWPSSENTHLYYRFRRSYADFRELGAAPGHYFLDHETLDLASYLDLVIRFGWGGWLLPSPGPIQMFVSHDEWIRIEAAENLEGLIQEIESLSIPYEKN